MFVLVKTSRHLASGDTFLRFYLKYAKSKNCHFRNIYSSINNRCLYSSRPTTLYNNIQVQPQDGSTVEEIPKKNYKKRERPLMSPNVIEYINTAPSLMPVKDLVISALMERKPKYHKVPYLTDRRVARDIANVIVPKLICKDCLVLEVNPGVGFLTEHLIKARIQELRCYESNHTFFSYLKEIKFPNLNIYRKNVVSLWKLQMLDKLDDGMRIEEIFHGIKPRSWDDVPAYQLIAALPDSMFVRNLIFNIVNSGPMLAHGRPELFLIMDPLSYTSLINKGDSGYRTYSSLSVLFQIIFDSKVLIKVPRNVFLPWTKLKVNQKSSSLKKLAVAEGDLMYVVQVTAKPDLAGLVLHNQVAALYYFVKQLFSSCSLRLIPHMEKWIPGCGPRLISKGYNIYTEMGELTPDEVLNIFLDIVYADGQLSSFYSAMELDMLRRPLNDDINFDLEEDDQQ